MPNEIIWFIRKYMQTSNSDVVCRIPTKKVENISDLDGSLSGDFSYFPVRILKIRNFNQKSRCLHLITLTRSDFEIKA